MASFLLLWSPKGWQWDPSAYAEVVHRTANGEGVAARWSTGQRRDGIGPGDRGYLVRTRDARGIVAGATFDGGILEDRPLGRVRSPVALCPAHLGHAWSTRGSGCASRT